MILVERARIQSFVRRGWWGTRRLGDHFIDWVRRWPDREALVDPPNKRALCGLSPRRLSWGALANGVGTMVSALRAAGLRRDDVIVVQLANGCEQYEVYLACACLGIIVSPVPAQFREHELDQVLTRTRARLAIVAARIGRHALGPMWATLRERHPEVRGVWAYTGAESRLDAAAADTASVDGCSQGALPAGIVPAEAVLSAHAPVALEALHDPAVTADDVVTLCWTSGTEAAPKAVPRSHNEWLIVGLSVFDAARLGEGARVLNPFPFVNMAGLSTGLASWLLHGGTIVQHHPFDAAVFIAQLRAESLDYTIAAPALLAALLKEPDQLAGVDFQRLARIGSGSAPLPEWVVSGFAERFGVQIVNYFGSNEGASLAGTPEDIPDPAQRAVFFPRIGVAGFQWRAANAPKVRTRLVDVETGEDIDEPGRPGELRFSGATIFSGYWQAPEQTRTAFDEQGFYRTGDLFEIAGDARQFYRFVGRAKDVIVRGGMKVSSEEVESLLAGHPAVREAAVVGWPDALLGERVCAVIVPREAEGGPSLEALCDWLREHCRIAAYKLPEHVLTVDALPRNPVGKVLKRELRARIDSMLKA